MKVERIKYKGIVRSYSDQDIDNGYLDEAINVRHKNGKLTRRGHPTKLYNLPAGTFDKIFYHDQDGIGTYIGYNKTTKEVRLINMVLGTSTLIISPISGTDVNIVFLKRSMIIISDEGLKVFLYTQDKVYVQTEELTYPEVNLKAYNAEKAGVQANEAATWAGILARYYENLNRLSNESGKLNGSIMYITAYRLFDGSYILPSIPKYLELSNIGNLKFRNPGGGGTEDRQFWLEFYGLNVVAVLNNDKYASTITAIKDIVESICVFATKATPLNQINETSLTDTKLADDYGNYYNSTHYIDTWPFKDVFPVINSEFKELAKSKSWYKIHEFAFEDVIGKTGNTTVVCDTKGFYQDYATRETLTTDQFTHHKLSAREAYVYNDRLHLANIKTSLAGPYVVWPDSSALSGISTEYDGIVSVWLKTGLGNSIVQSNINVPVYLDSALFSYNTNSYEDAKAKELEMIADPEVIPGSVIFIDYTGQDEIGSYQIQWLKYNGSTPYFQIPSVVGYNDYRAYKIQIAVTMSGSDYLLTEQTLIKNEVMNFSFWHNTGFSADGDSAIYNYKATKMLVSAVSGTAPIDTIPDVEYLPFDTNRIQVSEIQNPLIFPAKNSYQVGTGSIISIKSRSIPLSQGQFGQFPLQVFTTSGIWAMEQGAGDVLYSNIVPVNGEVAVNKDQIIPLSYGVTYSTREGLFVVSGQEVTPISQLLTGTPNLDIQEEENYLHRLDLLTLVQLANNLSTVDAKLYIQGSKIGFDSVNNELLVSNTNYQYSYVFNFESKSWYKISESFNVLINCYPQLLVLRDNEDTGVFTLSVETFDSPINVLLTTRPVKFDGGNIFTLLHRIIQLCDLRVPAGTFAGFYVFASNDCRKWQLMNGSDRKSGKVTDIRIGRIHVKAKYFVFVFASSLQEDSSINDIYLQYYDKLDRKIR